MSTPSSPKLAQYSPLPVSQFRWFIRFFHLVFIVGFCLTLVLRWRRPENVLGPTDIVLMVLVITQITLYVILFAIPAHTGRWGTGKGLAVYFVASIAIYLVECRLDKGFHWAVGFYLGQLLALPWRISIPGTIILFAGYFLVVFGWNELSHFNTLNWFIALGIVAAWTIAFLFLHRALATSSERGRLIAELEAAKRELEQARQRDAELAALRERERLARDLHDSLGHSLVTLTVQMEAAQRLFHTDPARAKTMLEELQKLTRSSMEDLRRSLGNLRAPGLEGRELLSALKTLCEDVTRLSQTEIQFNASGAIVNLPPVVTDELWRVAQEAVTNIQKHAKARHAEMTLATTSHEVTLSVRDDGIGLPPEPGRKAGHYGLRGMRERVEGLGGTFSATGNGAAGTLIEVRVPLIN